MSAARSTTPLDSIDAALLQQRVGNVGVVIALIGIVFVVMRAVSMVAVGRPDHILSESMLAHYTGVGLAVGLWLTCRVAKLSSAAVHALELIGLTVICGAYAVTAVGIPQAFRPEMTLLLTFGVLLLAHAVHVPSTWRWTVLLGLSLAIPLIVGAWYILTPLDPRIVEASASAEGSVRRSAASIIGIAIATLVTWWIVMVATAAAASAVIYGLRREVRHARQLGQYTIERKLGEGGMAVVYVANHRMLRRPTAVKVFLPEKVGSLGLARFEREVRATARLAHPNTVTIYDYGRTADGLFYYAMELLDGASLAEVVELTGRMPPGRVVHILHQVAGALTEAHELGLIHRDIKPANIMLTQQGGAADVAKVVDFGLVKAVAGPEDGGRTADNALIGTPQCMAPEAIAGKGPDTPSRDLYALGCVGYFLLTGEHVFSGATLVEICAKHLDSQPDPPSRRLGAPVPEDLEALILELLAKAPEARPASAALLCRRLEVCRSFGSWSQTDARDWWRQFGPLLGAQRDAGDVTPLGATTLEVDIDNPARAGRPAPRASAPGRPTGGSAPPAGLAHRPAT